MPLSGGRGPSHALDPGQYASLALTHVQYHPDDPLSLPLSLITLAPPFLLVSYITLILVRREMTLIVGLVGQLACEGLNLALKRLFKQGRPTDFLGTGYGMPSSHSQFMGYFMSFWCIHLYRFRPGQSRARRAKKLGQSTTISLSGTLRSMEHLAIVAFIVSLSFATAYSRYHLSYHTALQIVVGFSVGTLTGIGWYYIFEVLAGRTQLGMSTPLRHVALDNSLLVALRIRDSWAVWDDGGVEGEYGFWRREWDRRRSREEIISSESEPIHLTNMLRALQLADKCDGTDAAFSVGCVIAQSSTGKIMSTGHSRQKPGNTHAEEVALNGLTMESTSRSKTTTRSLSLDLYTTMEPCSERLSKKSPCVQRILDFNKEELSIDGRILRITRIFQAVKEPDDFVLCAGTDALKQSGLTVITVPGPTRMREEKSGRVVEVASGWLEREALRLAKKGHKDQKEPVAVEASLWSQAGWSSAPREELPPASIAHRTTSSNKGSEPSP